MASRHWVAPVTLALATLSVRAQQGSYPPGVTEEVHVAIQRGLQWLEKNQASDGSWRNSGGYGSYPAAMTGLAGMALKGMAEWAGKRGLGVLLVQELKTMQRLSCSDKGPQSCSKYAV